MGIWSAGGVSTMAVGPNSSWVMIQDRWHASWYRSTCNYW